MLEILGAAAAFGLSGGLSPGPLLALLVAETLTRGRRAGLAVAMSPLVTDGPIIVVSMLLLARIEDSAASLGLINLAGGCLLTYWGVSGLRSRHVEFETEPAGSRPWSSLGKGVSVNFLNPNPYLFWLTVGAPMLVRADQAGRGLAVLCLFAFYFGLVGSKILLAVLVARSASVLHGQGYVWCNRLLAAVLLVYAAVFVREGLARLAIL